MMVLRRFSPAPVLRLLAAPRLLLVLAGGASWTLGAGWFGTMLRFKTLQPGSSTEAEVYAGLLATLLLFGVPALVGVVVGEAAQEVFRRPMCFRLPGVVRRMAGAARSLGLATCLLVTACLHLGWDGTGWWLGNEAPGGPGVLAAFSVALAGFAAGSWLLARVGYGWGWLLRLAGFLALAYAAQPLLAAATGSTVLALAVGAGSALAATQRFQRGIAARMAAGSVPTIFGRFCDWGHNQHGRQAVRARDPGRLPPRAPLGGNLQGWMRARYFEQRTNGKGTQTWQAITALAALFMAIGLVGPIMGWLLEHGEEAPGLLLHLAAFLLGPPDGAAPADLPAATGFFIALAAGAALQAFMAVTPLMGRILYPISRRMRARIAFRAALGVGLAHTAAMLLMGLGLGAGLLALEGAAWPAGLPPVAAIALMHLLLFPLYAVGALRLRLAASRRRLGRAALAYGLLLAGLLGILAGLQPAWETALEALPPLLSAALYAVLAAGGFCLLRAFLQRHYTRVDLV